MLSSVLNSPHAIAINIEIMRVFVQMRAMAASHKDLASRLSELEDKTESLAMQHDTFSRNTRVQLKRLFDSIRELMTPPEPAKRPIGFVTPQDKSATKRPPGKGATKETEHLLSTPANAAFLATSITQYRKGLAKKRKLIDA
jgi:arsenate reductase-like glutaredoxin family protein